MKEVKRVMHWSVSQDNKSSVRGLAVADNDIYVAYDTKIARYNIDGPYFLGTWNCPYQDGDVIQSIRLIRINPKTKELFVWTHNLSLLVSRIMYAIDISGQSCWMTQPHSKINQQRLLEFDISAKDGLIYCLVQSIEKVQKLNSETVNQTSHHLIFQHSIDIFRRDGQLLVSYNLKAVHSLKLSPIDNDIYISDIQYVYRCS
jgi:hypothetical protein